MGILDGLLMGVGSGLTGIGEHRIKMQDEELKLQAERDKEQRIEEAQIRQEGRAEAAKESDYQKSVSPERVQTGIDIALKTKSAQDQYTKDNWGDHIQQLKDETNAKQSDSDIAFNNARANYYNASIGGSSGSGTASKRLDLAVDKNDFSQFKELYNTYGKEVGDIESKLADPELNLATKDQIKLKEKLNFARQNQEYYLSKMQGGDGFIQPAASPVNNDPAGLKSSGSKNPKIVEFNRNNPGISVDETMSDDAFNQLKPELEKGKVSKQAPIAVIEKQTIMPVLSKEEILKSQQEMYRKNAEARKSRDKNGLLRTWLLSKDDIDKQNKIQGR